MCCDCREPRHIRTQCPKLKKKKKDKAMTAGPYSDSKLSLSNDNEEDEGKESEEASKKP